MTDKFETFSFSACQLFSSLNGPVVLANAAIF